MAESVQPVSPQSQVKRVGRKLFGDVLEQQRQHQEAERQRHFREDVTEWLVASSSGIDLSKAPLHRYISAEIYVDTARDQNPESYAIATAFDNLLEAAGFQAADNSVPTFGSLHSKRTHRTKSRKSQRGLDYRLSLLQMALGESFREVGAEVNESPDDQGTIQRIKAREDAELAKTLAEGRKANAEADMEPIGGHAEAFKARSEGMKALAEAANTFAKAIGTAAVSFAIVIGTLHMWGGPVQPQDNKPTIEFKVDSQKTNDVQSVSGSVWVHMPEKKARHVEPTEDDPLDAK